MPSELDYIQSYKEHLELTNYSERTIVSYLSHIRSFFKYCKTHKQSDLPFQEYVRKYLYHLRKHDFSWSTINSNYSSLKLLYEQILKGVWVAENLPRPKMPKKLPRVLSQQEVSRLIEAPSCFKHRVIIIFLYATGLRISGALNIKVSDIDSERLEIYVSQGKGAKDRLVSLPEALLIILRQYYVVYKPPLYLFQGLSISGKYSKSSVRKILIRARAIAKISKPLSAHTLRHCYATHQLENGTDLVYIKEQLGHSNLMTTAKYIHLCGPRHRYINHPIDKLSLHIEQSTI